MTQQSDGNEQKGENFEGKIHGLPTSMRSSAIERESRETDEWVKLPKHPHYAICPPSVSATRGCVDIPTNDIRRRMKAGRVQQGHRGAAEEAEGRRSAQEEREEEEEAAAASMFNHLDHPKLTEEGYFQSKQSMFNQVPCLND